LALIYLEDMGRIQEQAQQLKLAALGRLTANMAHEIRNPLSAISHAAELLAEDASAEVRGRLVAIIGDNTQRLNRLVAEVLELGRRDRAQREDIELATFLGQFVEEWYLHDPSSAGRIALDKGSSLVLRFDRSHLHRVLTNLVGNALRHATPTVGSVRIFASPGGKNGVIELHVVDDGPGIEESLRGQIFEPFFTTHAGGTGLGLYIARELCEANEAQLELIGEDRSAHFRILGKGGAWSAGAAIAGN
jgi:two-component system sensor histidine kinase PilS (NtrC family)